MTTALSNRTAVRWTVERRPWKQFGAELPDEIVNLVAPPLVVSASPDEPVEDDDEESHPSPLEPCARA